MSVRYSDIRDLEKQLIEAREQIAAYQVRVDNDARRMDAIERTKDSLMRECAERDGFRGQLAPCTSRNFQELSAKMSPEARDRSEELADRYRVEIAADLLRDMAKARSREANLAHPLTADRFSQVLDAD